MFLLAAAHKIYIFHNKKKKSLLNLKTLIELEPNDLKLFTDWMKGTMDVKIKHV